MTEDGDIKKAIGAGLAVGRAMGRREAAERTALLLRSLVSRWAARISARGVLVGPLLAEISRGFVADLEHEATAIEAQVPLAKTEERRLRNELDELEMKLALATSQTLTKLRAEAEARARKPWWTR